MKTKNSYMLKISTFAILLITAAFFLSSCNDKKNEVSKKDVETMNSGKLTAYCDNTLVDLMDSTFQMYRSLYPDVELTIETGTARDVMSNLLSGKARVIIIARDYLHDEDSLMQKFDVKPHAREEIADDALCFFTGRDNPLDTLNDAEIYNVLTTNKKFTDYYKILKAEPTIVTCDQNSSIYANLQRLPARSNKISRKLIVFSTVDSVKQYVKNNQNSIGVLYLHNVIRNLDFKTIPIGYADSTGKYITPKPVHQAYIIQGLYPYTVTFSAIFLEDFKNLPFWFGAFIAREAIVTRYLKEAGVVPKFAKFTLINED